MTQRTQDHTKEALDNVERRILKYAKNENEEGIKAIIE